MNNEPIVEPNSQTYYKIYKPFFEKIESYIPASITPNMITITNFILINILFFSKLYYNPFIFSLVIFLYWVLDNIDGIHARRTKQSSKIGETLDHCIDGYTSVLFTFMFFRLFGVDMNYIFLFIFLLTFNLGHITGKYTKSLALYFKIGSFEISIDDLFLVGIFVPYLKYLNFKKGFSVGINILSILLLVIIASKTINLVKLRVKPIDLIGTYAVTSSYYYIKNPIIIAIMQILFCFYTIHTR